MNRSFVFAPDHSGAPLADLKRWLSISTEREDALLLALLGAAITACERFTGLLPLATLCEETLDVGSDWSLLATRPVSHIGDVNWFDHTNNRIPVAAEDYEAHISADGTARVKPAGSGEHRRIVVRFNAGAASDWTALDPALREGILRLAAQYYRERDEGGAAAVPASVTALWRPFVKVRLT